MRKILLKSNLALGDAVLMTAAVRDLHRCYPGVFLTDVRTSCGSLWNFNPYLTHLDENDPEVESIRLDISLIDWSNLTPYHALEGFIDNLNEQLGLQVRCTEFKGDVHLSPEEKSAPSRVRQLAGRRLPYWLVFAGGRHEITVKWWDTGRYQEVVDAFRGRIQFVQAGGGCDYHPRLEGTIDLRGRTTVRELLQLIYHAEGVLCGVTGPMHLSAAVELPGRPQCVRPCVVIAGGREPAHWEQYPGHQFIHNVGALPCCDRGGCWKTRTVPLGDGSDKDEPGELCLTREGDLPLCMHLISAEEVIRRIDLYFSGGALRYLTPDQAAAGLRAIQRNAPNPIDTEPLALANARYACERFCRTPRVCPDRFGGRGIVICAGGLSGMTEAWMSVRLLRARGCTLPVELWDCGADGGLSGMIELLRELGVTWVERGVFKNGLGRAPRGPGEAQAYALAYSSFEEALLLTPGLIPVGNPEYLFELAGFKECGALVWPDRPVRQIKPQAWHLCGLEVSKANPFYPWLILVNKPKCWEALTLWLWFHEQGHVYYPHTHEGTDLAQLAFSKKCARYLSAARRDGRRAGWCDPEGKLAFSRGPIDAFNLYLSPTAGRASAANREWRTALEELRGRLKIVPPRGFNPTRVNEVTLAPLAPRPSGNVCNGHPKPVASAVPLTLVTLHDDRMAGVGKVTSAALRRYAERQGYGFVYHDRLLDPARHASWNKILAVRRAMAEQKDGWIMWLDADAMVMNQQIRAESLIPTGCDLVAASDANGLVAGVFLIRCCEWSLQFLDTVFFLGDMSRDSDGDGPKWEQNTMKHVLENFAGFAEHAVLLPERQLNSDLRSFQPGDFILHLGLTSNGNRERIFRQAWAWVTA